MYGALWGEWGPLIIQNEFEDREWKREKEEGNN